MYHLSVSLQVAVVVSCILSLGLANRLDPRHELDSRFSLLRVNRSLDEEDPECSPPKGTVGPGALAFDGSGLSDNGRDVTGMSFSLFGIPCAENDFAQRWTLPSEPPALKGANSKFAAFVEETVRVGRSEDRNGLGWLFAQGSGSSGRKVGTARVIWCGASVGISRWILIRSSKGLSQKNDSSTKSGRDIERFMVIEAVAQNGKTRMCAFGEDGLLDSRLREIAEGGNERIDAGSGDSTNSNEGRRLRVIGVSVGSIGGLLIICAVTAFWIAWRRKKELRESTIVEFGPGARGSVPNDDHLPSSTR